MKLGRRRFLTLAAGAAAAPAVARVAWGQAPRVNRLVFIGRGLDRAELEAGFESAVAKS